MSVPTGMVPTGGGILHLGYNLPVKNCELKNYTSSGILKCFKVIELNKKSSVSQPVTGF